METYGLEKLGITNTGKIYRNLDVSRLVEESLKRGEGILMNTGALAVTTGKYTGRYTRSRVHRRHPGHPRPDRLGKRKRSDFRR